MLALRVAFFGLFMAMASACLTSEEAADQIIESDTGPVVLRPCSNDSDCQEARPCYGHEQCLYGQCYPGPAVPISDGLQCTNDICDTKTGEITHPPVDVDDHDDCTEDGCTEGEGVWNKLIQTPSCISAAGFGLDCNPSKGAKDIDGQPCKNDDDCFTGSPCAIGVCVLNQICGITWAPEGTVCPSGGLCDGQGMCCLPL